MWAHVETFLYHTNKAYRITAQYVYEQCCMPRHDVQKGLKRRTHEITYYHTGKPYKVVVKDTTPFNILNVLIADTGDDVTEYFKSYFGHWGNFHGMRYSPSDLGLTDIVVHTLDNEYRFGMDDIIEF